MHDRAQSASGSAPARAVFIVSDGTGITAETLSATLLTQFDGVTFSKTTLPFINSVEKARSTVDYINHVAAGSTERPLVFSTTVADEIRTILREVRALFIDFFDMLIPPIEAELGRESAHTQGRAHGLVDSGRYGARIAAVNFAMEHDDGSSVREISQADVILVAPSRCGKTPTALYLALQKGLRAANVPLTDEDLEDLKLPKSLNGHENLMFGLTSNAERLSQIRGERRPGSRYASIDQCGYELRQAEALYRKLNVPFVDTSTKSVEEIAAIILQEKRLQ